MSISIVFSLCLLYNVSYPEIVASQYALETGYGTSRVFKQQNNLFGFYYKGKYMDFESPEHCILYYKDWQKRKLNKYRSQCNDGDYYHFLSWIGYAEDTLYISKLKSVVRRNKKSLTEARDNFNHFVFCRTRKMLGYIRE